jgi:glucose-6-phosphate isomerase
MYSTSPLVTYTCKSATLSNTLTSAHHTALNDISIAIQKATSDSTYSSLYASVHCSFDIPTREKIALRVSAIGTVDYAVIIGIGGSILGFRAIYEALQDYATIKKNHICILETIDSAAVITALDMLRSVLEKKLCVHIIVISKSGTTTETISLWRVVHPLLETYYPDNWQTLVTIITDTGSPFETYAHEHSITVLNIPPLVGGRYSVFSAAGLFPLALCGIALQPILDGAQNAISVLQNRPLQTSFPVQHALALSSAYYNNYQVHDTFIFSTWCSTIGLWYRQLSAESLGKINIHGKQIAMIPTVSIGSTDLHAIGQLYLSGAHNFWTTFITLNELDTVYISQDNALNTCAPSLHNRSLNDIMTIINTATIQAYHNRNIPYSHITLTVRSPYTIGYLMQSYMLAIMYAASLFEVNAFDQPNVEEYKKITRQLLI